LRRFIPLTWINARDRPQGQGRGDFHRDQEAPMLPLMLIIHIFLGSTAAGSAIVVALVLGYDTTVPIVVAGGVGFLAAIPASWAIAKRLAG
jgi:hypothetical protein